MPGSAIPFRRSLGAAISAVGASGAYYVSSGTNKIKVSDEDNNVLKDETVKESKEEVYTEKTLKVEKGKVFGSVESVIHAVERHRELVDVNLLEHPTVDWRKGESLFSTRGAASAARPARGSRAESA